MRSLDGAFSCILHQRNKHRRPFHSIAGFAIHLSKTHGTETYWTWRRKQDALRVVMRKPRVHRESRYHRGASAWATNLWAKAQRLCPRPVGCVRRPR